MKKFDKFGTAQVKTGSVFDQLPKGAYVIKIMRAEECRTKKDDGSYIKIAFDIAEGEYKDFYKKQLDAMPDEDKHWPYDGIYNLSAPDDDSPQWMIDNFGTFIAALEDSNNGYHWDWDETKWKNLVVGALFRIEQNESNGNVYDHTRPWWFRAADSIRNKKYGRLPKDKLITAKQSGDDFINVPDGADADEIPF